MALLRFIYRREESTTEHNNFGIEAQLKVVGLNFVLGNIFIFLDFDYKNIIWIFLAI